MQNGDMLILVDTEHHLFRTTVGVTVPFYATFSNYDRRLTLFALSFVYTRMKDKNRM